MDDTQVRALYHGELVAMMGRDDACEVFGSPEGFSAYADALLARYAQQGSAWAAALLATNPRWRCCGCGEEGIGAVPEPTAEYDSYDDLIFYGPMCDECRTSSVAATERRVRHEMEIAEAKANAALLGMELI